MAVKKFVWKKDFAVGVPWIDEQHKHFFKLINELLSVVSKKSLSRKDLLYCLTHLANHAFYHFDSEEKHLVDAGYPGIKKHIAAHGKYREEIKSFLEVVNNEKTDIRQLADKIVAFAGDWLSRHMLGINREKARFLRALNNKPSDLTSSE